MKMLGGQNEVVYAFIQQWYMAFYNEPDTILGPEIRFAIRFGISYKSTSA